MPYYISYILNTDNEQYYTSKPDKPGLYHASVALTEHNPPENPKIVAKIGFFASSQIEVEDFLRKKPGREFYHRTYAVTQKEAEKFMEKVNADRRIGVFDKSHKEKEEEGEIGRRKMLSVPGGPAYSFYRLNCKTYAMSVLKYVGINDKVLKNWIVDNPGSSKLIPFEFTKLNNNILEWNSPMVVSNRLDQAKLNVLSEQERHALQTSIQFNEMRGVFADIVSALRSLEEERIPGSKNLQESFIKILRNIKSFKEKYVRDIEQAKGRSAADILKMIEDPIDQGFGKYFKEKKLKYRNNHQLMEMYVEYEQKRWKGEMEEKNRRWLRLAETAVQTFESVTAKEKTYGLKSYIIDSLKRALNYLGASFTLSSHYKATAITSKYKKELTKIEEVSPEPLYSPKLILDSILSTEFIPSKDKQILEFSSHEPLRDEPKFLNQLKALLRDQGLDLGMNGVQRKAQYLYAAMELVLQSESPLTAKMRQEIQKEMDKLNDVKGKPIDAVELEKFLGNVAKEGKGRFLIDKCHELIVEKQLKRPLLAPEPKK